MSNFFAKVSRPVLTQVKLDYGDAEVFQTYPTKMLDLFAGQQVTVIGRYKKPGKATLKLSGERMGKASVSEYPVEFPESNESADFLPRLWAMRRVGYLVEQITKNGENKELKDEVIQLGKQYAIATPYTSFLVTEDTKGNARLAAASTGGVVSNVMQAAPSAAGGMGRRCDERWRWCPLVRHR